MMRISRSGAVLTGMLVVAAFGTLSSSSARYFDAAGWRFTGGDDKPASVTAAIAKVRDQWAKQLHAKELEPLVLLYAPDAVFLEPTGERVAGREAIRELCRNIMASFTSNIHLRSVIVEHSGNLAYDSGEFNETLVSAADGSKIETKGSYLMIFKRQADGKWLILEQVWTGAPPPQTGPAPK